MKRCSINNSAIMQNDSRSKWFEGKYKPLLKRTWRQILTETTGVDQHIGLKSRIKLIMSAEGQQHSDQSAITSSTGCTHPYLNITYLLYSNMSGVQTWSGVKRRFLTPGYSDWFHCRQWSYHCWETQLQLHECKMIFKKYSPQIHKKTEGRHTHYDFYIVVDIQAAYPSQQ